MATIKELEELFRANQPIIWINSFEERRVMDEILGSSIVGYKQGKNTKNETVDRINPKRKVYTWSATSGLVKLEGSEFRDLDHVVTNDKSTLLPVGALARIAEIDVQKNKGERMVVIMKDMHALFNDPRNVRKIRDMINHFGKTCKTLFLVGPSNKIPDELQKDVYMVDYDFPTPDKISELIDKAIAMIYRMAGANAPKDKADNRFILGEGTGGKRQKLRATYSEEERKSIIRAAQGMTQQEIICSFSKSMRNTEFGELEFMRIADDKKNLIAKSQVLEYDPNTEPFSDVGGNDAVKTWLQKRGSAITGELQDFGAHLPKGCVLVGVPGCGKSMMAKASAGLWKLPFIRLDMGKIYAGIVGASEKNMRDMINQVEAMAPCVLFIDEVEKGVSGTASSGQTDGGTTSRVFGTFIQWLNDKKSSVFVICTANNIKQLPAELTRKGRIDDVWFVDLPTKEERKDIFEIQLKRFKRDPKKFDLNKLAKTKYSGTDGEYDYSGSEIEEAINDAIFAAADRIKTKGKKPEIGCKGDVSTKDILDALKVNVPVSCRYAKKINDMREWGKKHARFSSTVADKKYGNMSKAKVTTKSEEGKAELNLHEEDLF